jgi:cell division septum initiation protein DivIVA
MTDNHNHRQTNIEVGDISDTSGTVNIAGGNIATYHTASGLSAAEVKQLFDQIYARIEARANTTATDREDLRATVEEIQQTVTSAAQKNEKLDEGFLRRRFRNIARMAPDILDVVVATLANPLAGLGVAAAKIAEKAKEGIA